MITILQYRSLRCTKCRSFQTNKHRLIIIFDRSLIHHHTYYLFNKFRCFDQFFLTNSAGKLLFKLIPIFICNVDYVEVILTVAISPSESDLEKRLIGNHEELSQSIL